MSGVVQCFWIEPTELVQVYLRRFTFEKDKKCRATNGGHDASQMIEAAAPRSAWEEDQADGYRSREDLVSHDDPRWPAECDNCSEPFQIDDESQLNTRRLYQGAPDGKLYPVREVPPGSMWDAAWWPDKGPDGTCLMVKLPDGSEWMVDDGRWQRTGDPRQGTVSVQPSIKSPRYHGFLTNGKLAPMADSQT